MTASDANSAHPAEVCGGTRERIGTIGDVMTRYNTDPGGAWELIHRGDALINHNGDLVRLVANRDEREGTLWIVYEERVA